MNQKGYIVKIVDRNTVKIKMQKHSACASCGKCASSTDKKDIIVEADNSIGARIGDYVEVNMDSINVIKAALIAYVIPLVALLGGTIIPYSILSKVNLNLNVELISGCIGIILTLITYLIIKSKDYKFRQSRAYIPIITKIVNN
ncbi:MAG: SoxR reducing system RseC family protein [Paraclostridium sp.]